MLVGGYCMRIRVEYSDEPGSNPPPAFGKVISVDISICLLRFFLFDLLYLRATSPECHPDHPKGHMAELVL